MLFVLHLINLLYYHITCLCFLKMNHKLNQFVNFLFHKHKMHIILGIRLYINQKMRILNDFLNMYHLLLNCYLLLRTLYCNLRSFFTCVKNAHNIFITF